LPAELRRTPGARQFGRPTRRARLRSPRALSQFRLDSIRGQILAFAILAALIPSLIISLIAYAQSHRALKEKITQELKTTGLQAGRETDLWLKDRLTDLRVFANSPVVSETVARRGQAGRLVEYLYSVRARFADYEELQLVDANAGLVASSARGASPARLPEGWGKTFKSSRSLVGEPYWDEKAQKMIVILGVPVLQADGRIAGALVARANFAELKQVLRVFSARSAGHVYLATAGGTLIADSRNGPADGKTKDLAPGVADRLLAADGEVVEHRGIDGIEVLGSAQGLSQAEWLAVADRPIADAYHQATRLRNEAFLVIGVLLVVIAVLAYWLAALIARPLRRLTSAAAQVSAGDLPAGLPAGGGGEVGYLTQVFNTMVESLRKHHDELERLSTIDTLTGLSNRRHLMDLLAHEIERAKRAGQPFSILMLDVDHFKKYNDTHGHQAGDEVLARVSTVLRNSIRPYDCAARYGGEEFLVMLSATSLDRAKESAERIRKQVRAEQFEGGSVTISIGVAEYPSQGDTAKSVIGEADAALYEAKRAGRDRIICAGTKSHKAKAGAS
jgi:diguanylate cyclase (GGDEF)-like protein